MRALVLLVPLLVANCVPSQEELRGAGHVIINGAPDNSGVTVTDTETDDGDEEVTTGPTGEFHFHGDLPGLVTATAEWTVEGTAHWSTRWANAHYPELPMTAAGDIVGRVTLNGQPNGNAGITVTVGDLKATTDENGYFAFKKIAVGIYPVTAVAVGYHEANATVTAVYKATTALGDLDLLPDQQ